MRKVLTFLIALASIAFGVCSPAHAAVAIDATGTKQVSTSVQTFNYTGLTTNTGLSNAGIVVIANFTTGTVTGVSATWAGQSMTPIGSCTGGNPGLVCLFGLVGISTLGAQTLALSWTGNSVVTVDAMSFTGVNQSTPFPNPNSATGTGTAISVNITSASGEYVLAGMTANSFPPNLNSVNNTQLYIDNSSFAQGANYATGAASVTMSGTLSASSAWTILGTDIAAAGGGSAHCQSRMLMGVGC